MSFFVIKILKKYINNKIGFIMKEFLNSIIANPIFFKVNLNIISHYIK